MYMYIELCIYIYIIHVYIYSKSMLFAHHTYAEYDIHISA